MNKNMRNKMMDKEDIKDKKKGKYRAKEEKKEKTRYAGKGTRARLNTAAEKNFFKSKVSK